MLMYYVLTTTKIIIIKRTYSFPKLYIYIYFFKLKKKKYAYKHGYISEHIIHSSTALDTKQRPRCV